MSVTVRQLNGDSTFLLIFSPETSPQPSDLRSANGAYSILIDPWIIGSSVTTASWFAMTTRVEPCAISHLAELDDEPDMVLCSQNKTDHTNKETLLQLRPEALTQIVAEPAAAKTIRSWNHFEPSRVHAISKYESRSKSDTVLRIPIPPLSTDGDPGEVTIAFIPAKNYVTGLHNAFGITYQPPTRIRTSTPVPTIDLKAIKAPSSSESVNRLGHPFMSVVTPPAESGTDRRPTRSLHDDNSFFEFSDHVKPEPFSVGQDLPTPPLSPSFAASTRSSSFSTMSSLRPSLTGQASRTSETSLRKNISDGHVVHCNRTKAISVIYSPHGIAYGDLQPYVRNHLLHIPGALPLSLLFHSFDHATNPWYLGGTIMTGAEGGMQIAKALMARCWISAHDEEKEDRGLATKMLKLKRNATGEVKELFQSQNGKSDEFCCDVRSLGVGESLTLANVAKAVVGLDVNRDKPLIEGIHKANPPAVRLG